MVRLPFLLAHATPTPAPHVSHGTGQVFNRRAMANSNILGRVSGWGVRFPSRNSCWYFRTLARRKSSRCNWLQFLPHVTELGESSNRMAGISFEQFLIMHFIFQSIRYVGVFGQGLKRGCDSPDSPIDIYSRLIYHRGN